LVVEVEQTRVVAMKPSFQNSIEDFWDKDFLKEQRKEKAIKDELEDLEEEDISASITQTWTDQAIKCLLINSDCNNCTIPRGNYSFKCQMNKVVPVLLKNLGEPEKLRVEKLRPSLNQFEAGKYEEWTVDAF